ncbi:hypothetical protein Asi02nite_51390 [Asanoa siamensis]|uniref:Uncharacterized protein n=1 Tax=Asanoa siamensis TaxID=926357 RepID=A0ABQ4CWG7_9ACTN|nr:hypothetical protein Asi02nite_51390 [Asanoa siamensis]
MSLSLQKRNKPVLAATLAVAGVFGRSGVAYALWSQTCVERARRQYRDVAPIEVTGAWLGRAVTANDTSDDNLMPNRVRHRPAEEGAPPCAGFQDG